MAEARGVPALRRAGLYLAGAYRLDALGAKPITALIHATGEWAVRFLLFSLAISPLRRIADWAEGAWWSGACSGSP